LGKGNSLGARCSDEVFETVFVLGIKLSTFAEEFLRSEGGFFE
jgi:hypothetical protein